MCKKCKNSHKTRQAYEVLFGQINMARFTVMAKTLKSAKKQAVALWFAQAKKSKLPEIKEVREARRSWGG